MGCFFWFVIFPIVILVIILNCAFHLIGLWFKSGDEMDKKRRVTNIIGIIVLGTIILGVTTQRGIQYLQERERIRNAETITLQMANDLANALVDDSSGDLVMKWARNDGEYLDIWGNPFIIEHNTIEKGACVRSYGSDGEPNTEDDIVSRIYNYEETKFEIETRPASGKMQEIKERFEGASRKAKEALETKKEEKGWKFRFSWGSKDEEEN